jgi:hypothetical protein
MKYSLQFFEGFEAPKSFIESISVRAKSPNEVLSALDKLGIESYVTEEDHLMIRYWQIGAQDFLPPEQAAFIRTSRSSPGESSPLDWVSKNLEMLCHKYAGKWIAVHDNAVAASASNLPEIIGQISGFDRPFITFIPAEPTVWNFTYAH